MGKFGIGARVRHDFGTGVVVSKTKGKRCVRFDGTPAGDTGRRSLPSAAGTLFAWLPKASLEPCPSEWEAPTELVEEIYKTDEPHFKVGDVVEVIDASGASPGDYSVGERCVVSHVDGRLVECKGKKWGMFAHRFKLAGPIITVTTGGYYKTRAGEIVGPMMRSSIEEFPFRAVLDGNIVTWREDGTWSLLLGETHDFDLISAVAAPEPKHKVGDRVAVMDNHSILGDEIDILVGSVHTIVEPAGYAGGWVLSGLRGSFLWDSQLAAAPLKEGDKVTLKALTGTLAINTRGADGAPRLRVDLGDGDFAWVSPSKLAA